MHGLPRRALADSELHLRHGAWGLQIDLYPLGSGRPRAPPVGERAVHGHARGIVRQGPGSLDRFSARPRFAQARGARRGPDGVYSPVTIKPANVPTPARIRKTGQNLPMSKPKRKMAATQVSTKPPVMGPVVERVSFLPLR